MAKPTKTPDHATLVTADPMRVVEPTTTLKEQGWPTGAKPAAQNQNWLFNNIYNWVLWLRDFEITAHTWEAKQTYNVSIECSNNVTNGYGIKTQGNGTGYGIEALGGLGGGAAVRAQGRGGLALSAISDTATAVNVQGGTNQTALIVAATGNASAASFTGAGTGHAVIATGGGRGVSATGGTNSPGVHATGNGTAPGVVAIGGATNAYGVVGTASGNAAGLWGIGGAVAGSGGLFQGGTAGKGLEAYGDAAGAGILARGGTSGIGLIAEGQGSAYGITATGGATGPGALIQAGGGNNNGLNVIGTGSGLSINATKSIYTDTRFIPGASDTGTVTPTPAIPIGHIGTGSSVYAWGRIVSNAFTRGKNIASVTSVATGHYRIVFNHTTTDDDNVAVSISKESTTIKDYTVTSFTLLSKLTVDIKLYDSMGNLTDGDFRFIVIAD